MEKGIVRKGDKTSLIKRADVYNEFVYWYAMPPGERMKLGIETQAEFAEVNKVHVNTLSAWKSRADFIARVEEIHRRWGDEMTGGVIRAIYQTAVKGNPMSQLLWLQYFKGFNPKAEAEKKSEKVEITVNDIRFLIEALPEQLRKKHYDNLRDLLDDSAAVATAIDQGETPEGIQHIANGDWSDRPEGEIRTEADNDAQDVQVERPNVVARSHTSSVCENMADNTVGSTRISTHHNQSASRGW